MKDNNSILKKIIKLSLESEKKYRDGDYKGAVEEKRKIDRSKLKTISFLSNITKEKGIIEFLDVCMRLNDEFHDLQFFLAGPLIDSEVLDDPRFRNLIESKNFFYLGPIYGDDKKNFFKNTDLLLFPTKYKIEAEPVTIIEALSYSIPVVSNDKGSITDILDNSSGLITAENEFVNSAYEYIKNSLANHDQYNFNSCEAQKRFNALKNKSFISYKDLKNHICL